MEICTARPSHAVPCLLLTTSILLAGCGPATQARRSMQAGDTLNAVRLYEEAVRVTPQDPQLQQELAGAREQAGEELSDDARAAADQRAWEDAVRLAENAGTYTPDAEHLANEVRDRGIEDLLIESDAALAAGRFGEARTHAQRARRLSPQDTRTVERLARIDDADAANAARMAETLASAGELDQARRAAARAVRLRPNEAAYVDLTTDFDRRGREQRFDVTTSDFRAHMEARRLNAADQTLAALTAMGVRADRLATLNADYNQARLAATSTLDDARTLEAAGDYDRALTRYDAAQALAADWDTIATDRDRCVARSREAEHLTEGQLAYDSGRYVAAVRAWQAALAIRSTPETSERIRLAQAADARQRLDTALTANDDTAALRAARLLLRYDDARDIQALRDRLTASVIDTTQIEASALHSTGRTDEAITMLERTMADVRSPQLALLHSELHVAQLTRHATEADQHGRFQEARSFYLEALAEPTAPPALASRINDVEHLADMEHRTIAAESVADDLQREVSVLHGQLNSAERDARRMRDDLTRCERDVRNLAQANNRLDRQYDDACRTIRTLECRVRDLAAEKDRIYRELCACRNDVTRWRRKYDDACRRRD